MKNRILILFIFAGLLGAANIGCNPIKKYEKEERQQIEAYLVSLGDTVYVQKPSGLYYIEIETGTGRMPVEKDTVSFRYEARLLDGTIFDTNLEADDPITFIVGSGAIIEGIDEGVRYMKDGGKAKILTPSSLAYGTQGIAYILPGYTPILFYIELVEVKAGTK